MGTAVIAPCLAEPRRARAKVSPKPWNWVKTHEIGYVARAQDKSPIARDAQARVTSAIRGRVLGPAGPLAGAEVRLDGDAIRPIPAFFTDTLGQYEFLNLPAGWYTVSARKNRYVTTTSRVRLAVDDRHDRADLTLVRTSAIAGQIIDEYGDPVEGVTVRLHQVRFVSGRRRLVEVARQGDAAVLGRRMGEDERPVPPAQAPALQLERRERGGRGGEGVERAEDVVDEARLGELRGADGASRLRLRLEDVHRPAGVGEVVGGDEPVRARADDDGVGHRGKSADRG